MNRNELKKGYKMLFGELPANWRATPYDNYRDFKMWLAYYRVLKALAPILTPKWFSPLGD